MKVLYIHNDYGLPSGEEHSAENIARLLTENGHTVSWFRRSSAELGHSAYGQIKAFITGVYNPASAIALERCLDSHRPHIVQVQNIYPLISPSIFPVLKRWGIPVIMRCPNYRLFCPNGLHQVKGEICERCLGTGREWWCILRDCEGNLLKSTGYALRGAVARIFGSIVENVNIFLVQSQFQKQKFVRSGIPSDRIEILPGMVRVTELPERISLGNMVSFVGRISPEKGVEEFIQAARMLPDIPFAIAGDDSRMPGIRDTSSPNIEWLGFLKDEELRNLYLRSRIIVVPSRCYEGFPNVLVEAMALGKPTICSNIGGMVEIVSDSETGLLFEPGNTEDLVEKIRLLYFNPELCRKYGMAAQESVRREYSAAVCYKRLIRAFTRAMDLNRSEAITTGSVKKCDVLEKRI